MGKYKFVSHTADIQVKVQAGDLEDLHATALRAMNEVLLPGACDKDTVPEVRKEVKVESVDRTHLLIDFLSEMLFLTEVEHAIFCVLEFKLLDSTHLRCIASGSKTERLDEEIKAVTYHGANVLQNKEGQWETNIVFDI